MLQGVRRFEFDSNLGVYPHDKFKKWGALSSHLTGEIIRLLEPVHRLIRSSIATTDGEQLLVCWFSSALLMLMAASE